MLGIILSLSIVCCITIFAQNGNSDDGKFLETLRQTGRYKSDVTTNLPNFTYEAAESRNLKKTKNFFKLDSIAGNGDEISQIINLMTWVHDNIRHDGSNRARCKPTAINYYKYHKSTGKGINCRQLAIMLNEMYLAMGFKSRYVTCLPKNRNDQDCHVIYLVYSETLQKWIWMDPTDKAYIKDENGNLLSIEEVRERLIDGRPLILNQDANWNNEQQTTKEHYLDVYMAKNLYFFECPANSRFKPEGRILPRGKVIALRPFGHTFQSNFGKITNNASYFWEQDWKYDINVKVSRADASEAQKNESIKRSIDGNIRTIYHSLWSGTSFPVTLTYYFDDVDQIDYIVYYPRTNGGRNGIFMEFELWVCEGDGQTDFIKIGEYDFKGVTTPSEIFFPGGLKSPKAVRFVVMSGVNEYVSCAEMSFMKKNP